MRILQKSLSSSRDFLCACEEKALRNAFPDRISYSGHVLTYFELWFFETLSFSMWELIRKDKSVEYSVVIPMASYYKARGRWAGLGHLNLFISWVCTGTHFLRFKNRLVNNNPLGWSPRIVWRKELGILGQASVILIPILSIIQS